MEKWAKQTQRDMDTVKMAIQRGAPPPAVKWEKRHIEAIKLCTDIRYKTDAGIPSNRKLQKIPSNRQFFFRKLEDKEIIDTVHTP